MQNNISFVDKQVCVLTTKEVIYSFSCFLFNPLPASIKADNGDFEK